MSDRRMGRAAPETVDQYIAACPPEVRRVLAPLRAAIRAAAPDAVEKVSYGMPAYWQNRILVYFAAHAKHVGLYPGAEAVVAFKDSLSRYVTSKGTVQFPYGTPIPLALVKRIVAFRVSSCAPVSRSRGRRAARPAARSRSG